MKPFQSIPIGLIVGAAALTPSGRANADAPSSCDVTEVEYALGANLVLSDTPLGQGDGTYAIGPGNLVIRVESGAPNKVRMMRYQMVERFKIHSKALFWSTDVTTNATTTTAADAQGTVAHGVLLKQTLEWKTDAVGYRTDGTLTCNGSLCGKFGAPPPGTTPLHIAPHPVRFRTFVFAPDMRTFSMPSTFVTRTESPKQTAHVELAGREIRRTCVSVKAPSS